MGVKMLTELKNKRATLIYKQDIPYDDTEYICSVQEIKTLSFWKDYGKDLKYNWLYKGYRRWGNITDQVIIFTNRPYPKQEIERRRGNGFIGIKEYYIGLE